MRMRSVTQVYCLPAVRRLRSQSYRHCLNHWTRSRLWDQPRSQRQHLWPLPKAGQRQVKGPHKRQISEAIPRAEREVARVPQGAAKEVAKVPEEAAEAVVDGLRKSARPRKPKSRS